MPDDIFKALVEESIEYWDKKAQKIDKTYALFLQNEHFSICQEKCSKKTFIIVVSE